MKSSAFTYLFDRESGISSTFQHSIYAQRVASIQPCIENYIFRRNMQVWTMNIHPYNDRYLLVGTSTSDIHLYDLQMLNNNALCSISCQYNVSNPLVPLSSINTQNLSRKRRASQMTSVIPEQNVVRQQRGISHVSWYPIDAGLFTVSSIDGNVLVYDSKCMQLACKFYFQHMIYTAKFSPIATTHNLIATAHADGDVRLCDLNAGTGIHTLLGHKSDVWCLEWSYDNEFHCISGDCDGELRLWDIRKSGIAACIHTFKQDANNMNEEVPSMYEYNTSQSMLMRSLTSGTRRMTMGGGNNTRRGQSRPTGFFSSQSITRNFIDSPPTNKAKAYPNGIAGLAYIPGTNYLAVRGWSGKLQIWNMKSFEPIAQQFMVPTQPRRLGVVKNQINPARGLQMAVVQEGNTHSSPMIFHPNGLHGEQLVGHYLRFSSLTDEGVPFLSSTAHVKQITSCVYRNSTQELFSGGDDGLIIRWEPQPTSFSNNNINTNEPNE